MKIRIPIEDPSLSGSKPAKAQLDHQNQTQANAGDFQLKRADVASAAGAAAGAATTAAGD